MNRRYLHPQDAYGTEQVGLARLPGVQAQMNDSCDGRMICCGKISGVSPPLAWLAAPASPARDGAGTRSGALGGRRRC